LSKPKASEPKRPAPPPSGKSAPIPMLPPSPATHARGERVPHLPPAPELTAATIKPPDAKATTAATAVAYIGSLLLLTSLAVYGQWVLTGVVEEKNNRVVELILSTVRPRHLLAGKVIGIGLLGLAQLALVAGLSAALLAAGVFDAPASLAGSLALVVPWFALGFALYAVAYAAAGALASRQQDANSAGQPVTYTLLAAYFVGYIALSADANGTLAHVLTVFPLTAPLVLPARNALVGVAVWEQALAVVLILGAIYALIRLAGRVYARGLLHTGPRLKARAVWRAGYPVVDGGGVLATGGNLVFQGRADGVLAAYRAEMAGAADTSVVGRPAVLVARRLAQSLAQAGGGVGNACAVHV